MKTGHKPASHPRASSVDSPDYRPRNRQATPSARRSTREPIDLSIRCTAEVPRMDAKWNGQPVPRPVKSPQRLLSSSRRRSLRRLSFFHSRFHSLSLSLSLFVSLGQSFLSHHLPLVPHLPRVQKMRNIVNANVKNLPTFDFSLLSLLKLSAFLKRARRRGARLELYAVLLNTRLTRFKLRR